MKAAAKTSAPKTSATKTPPAAKPKKEKAVEPRMLSYERSLYPTDAVFSAIDSETGAISPIEIFTKATLGTQSQHFADITTIAPGGNPQRVEAAALPPEFSLLKIAFNLTVTGSSLKPQACEVPTFRKDIMRFSELYRDQSGFTTIGQRIAANIANGRWAWKNRVFATSFTTKVTVSHPKETSFEFNSLDYDLAGFDGADKQITALGKIIANALSGHGIARFKIEGVLDIGCGSIVFPSQEFADKDEDKTAVGKILYGVKALGVNRCAAFHEQKIGNALRTIDTWHNGVEDEDGYHVAAGEPMPVNPYGQHRESHLIVRRGRSLGNVSFYQLLKELPNVVAELATGDVTDDAHFLAANLIRGGVYGFGEKPVKADKTSEKEEN